MRDEEWFSVELRRAVMKGVTIWERKESSWKCLYAFIVRNLIDGMGTLQVSYAATRSRLGKSGSEGSKDKPAGGWRGILDKLKVMDKVWEKLWQNQRW